MKSFTCSTVSFRYSFRISEAWRRQTSPGSGRERLNTGIFPGQFVISTDRRHKKKKRRQLDSIKWWERREAWLLSRRRIIAEVDRELESQVRRISETTKPVRLQNNLKIRGIIDVADIPLFMLARAEGWKHHPRIRPPPEPKVQNVFDTMKLDQISVTQKCRGNLVALSGTGGRRMCRTAFFRT